MLRTSKDVRAQIILTDDFELIISSIFKIDREKLQYDKMIVGIIFYETVWQYECSVLLF